MTIAVYIHMDIIAVQYLCYTIELYYEQHSVVRLSVVGGGCS